MRYIYRYTLVLFLTFISPLCAYADNDWCDRLGWHFSCDEEQEEESPKQIKPRRYTKAENQQVLAERDELRERIEAARARSVLYPSKQHIYEFKAEQTKVYQRADLYRDVWMQVARESPELNPALDDPVTTMGSRVKHHMQTKQKQEAIAKIGDRYGLFYFYKSTCPHCIEYSKILKAFADHYKVEVQAISLDGGILPEWEDSIINTNEARSLGIEGKPVPVTILFDSKTKEPMILGFGLMGMDQLEDTILRLTQEAK